MTNRVGTFAPEESANGSPRSFSSGKLFIRSVEHGDTALRAEDCKLGGLPRGRDGNWSASMPGRPFDAMHSTGVHIRQTDLARRNQDEFARRSPCRANPLRVVFQRD